VSESVDPRSRSELRALLRAIEEGGWEYARVEIDGMTLVVSQDPEPVTREQASAFSAPATVDQPATPAPAATASPEASPAKEPAAAALAPASGPAAEIRTVAAPSIGLFWRSPKPGAPPFVEVGDRIEAGDTVCIIEVMKLMTHVPADVAGVVRAIHVANGDMVEHGTALVDIEPEVAS
jgi:acetyl-CoA carboxylase biotin carboxyl carrier protein